MAEFCCRLIQLACQRKDVVIILENPCHSRLWKFPPLRKLLSLRLFVWPARFKPVGVFFLLFWSAWSLRLKQCVIAPDCTHDVLRFLGKSVIFDHCRFGTKWQKKTKLWVWGGIDVRSLVKKCCCPKGKKHEQLSGISGDKKHFKTSSGAAYPFSFCDLAAQCICSQLT